LGKVRACEQGTVVQFLEFVNSASHPDRETVTAVFGDRDLPTLLYMLTEKRARVLWDRLVPLVMHLGNPELSVPVLIRFVEQDDSYAPDELAKLNAKTDAVYALGLLGGDPAETYLRSLITRTGAERAARRWMHNDLPDPYRLEKSIVVALQRSAALGLVETGRPDNIALVEKMHADFWHRADVLYQRGSTVGKKEERDFLDLVDSLAEALVRRDVKRMTASGRKPENVPWSEVAQAFQRYSPRPFPGTVPTVPPAIPAR
jgi:hypothetical protein